MKNKFLLLATISTILFSVSCSDSNDYNPFDDQKRGDFYPRNIVIKKNATNKTHTEKWENITRDSEKRITGYKYTTAKRVNNSYENETREYKLSYYSHHTGYEVIESNINVSFSKSQDGINEKYIENITETATLNEKGYITDISTKIKHTDSSTSEPVISTSNRTFTYKGDLCRSSEYVDSEVEITYSYEWSGYRLTQITEHRVNKKTGFKERYIYEYTYDKKDVYPYTGNAILPFVQSGLPQIYASMGYLGKCTPYVLVGERQSGHQFDFNDTSESIEVNNTYVLSGDANSKLEYKAISDKHSEYSFTFSK